jgi:thiol-disulfide isomerase/thioredoxin
MIKTFKVLTILSAMAFAFSFIACKEQQKKADNSFTITVTGAEHFPEGARVAIYRSKIVESPESIEYLAKEAFKDNGTFVLEGQEKDVHIVTLDILTKENDYPYTRLMFPLESGETEIHFTGQRYFNYKGGKYGKLLVNSWNDNPDYKKAWSDLLNFNGDTKDSIQQKEYFRLNDRVVDLKKELLGKVANGQDEPLIKLLTYGVGYWGDHRVDVNATIEGLVAQVGSDKRQSKVAMSGVKFRRESKAAQATVGIGSVIKDFEAKNLAGETFHLANVLKENKYVLVEFWASWCSPCRAEIPHMKKAYSHFKEKGFEIVSFTLDHKEEAWKKASKDEGIPWIDTGDLLARTSPVVKLYGVTGVPANYLVEASTGKIVATDLRQEKLDNKLAELLGK